MIPLECPKCGANWPLVKQMLTGELGAGNKITAQIIIENCTECKENFVKVER